MVREEGRHGSSGKGSSKSSSKSKAPDSEANNDSGLPVSDPNWQWLCYEMLQDQFGRMEMRKIEASTAELDTGPFKVIYHRRVNVLWPDIAEVAVSSVPLKKILQQHFPSNGDLYSVTNPKMLGRDLFLVLPLLQNQLSQMGNPVESSPGKSDENDAARASSNGELHATNGIKTNDSPKQSNEAESMAVDGAKMGAESMAVDGAKMGAESMAVDGAKMGASENGVGCVSEEQVAALHLKHLVRFLELEYKEEIIRNRRMKEEKRVSWDMLWAFLSKGTRVAYHCDHTEELLCGVVASNQFSFNSESLTETPTIFGIDLDVWNFDGKQYKACQIKRYIRKYQVERDFDELSVTPIELLGDTTQLDADFLANGRRFHELAIKSTNQFMLYSGPMYRIREKQLTKTKSDGRVMIDLASFASMIPDYPMGNARAATSSKYTSSSRPDRAPTKYASDKYGGVGSEITQEAPEEASDETLIFAPAIVYGFSFELKEWGSFAVSGFSDIIFNTGAFEELTMDPGKKHLIHNLVVQYIGPGINSTQGVSSGRRVRVDAIAKKGEGCSFLCYGPPGTGKTLTAESIAEKMKRPLWSLSVSELGTNPRELEQRLMKIFEIAAKWHAVLLLDEADVYLETRLTGDLVRNAMTGVFLRLLEYYQGVLFLTTNRIKTFDEAFGSRISLFVHYPALSKESRAKIWSSLLNRVNAKGRSQEFCDEMAFEKLNGREIRNAIHMAQVWASSNDEVLDISHVKHVTKILGNSFEDLPTKSHSQLYM